MLNSQRRTSRFTPPFALVTCLVLAACSPPSTTDAGVDGGAADVTADAGSDAMPDAPACPPHTHEVSPGRCDISLSFTESTPVTEARDHHGTAIVTSAAGPRLVVTGGAALPAGAHDQVPVNGVIVAPILADGSIGAWTNGPSLSVARAGHAIGVIDNVVILTGGRAGGFHRTTTMSRMQPDGTLDTWTAGPSLPQARFHTTGAVNGRWMYVSGGLGIDSAGTVADARADVWGAELDTSGTLGAWQVMTSLPEPISHHASFVHDGYLYVAGGLGGEPFTNMSVPRTNVYRARIAANGSLDTWETLDGLPVWVSTHAVALHHDHVYVFGGVVDSALNSDAIYRARFRADGTLDAWEQFATSLPETRAHMHQAPVFDGRAYLVSGSRGSHMPVATTYVALFE